MFVVKVRCGLEEPSIAQPFRELDLALRWIARRAWDEFDGYAERAEIFAFDDVDPRFVIAEARAGGGHLLSVVKRPLTPEEQRRLGVARAV